MGILITSTMTNIAYRPTMTPTSICWSLCAGNDGEAISFGLFLTVTRMVFCTHESRYSLPYLGSGSIMSARTRSFTLVIAMEAHQKRSVAALVQGRIRVESGMWMMMRTMRIEARVKGSRPTPRVLGLTRARRTISRISVRTPRRGVSIYVGSSHDDFLVCSLMRSDAMMRSV